MLLSDSCQKIAGSPCSLSMQRQIQLGANVVKHVELGWQNMLGSARCQSASLYLQHALSLSRVSLGTDILFD